MMNFVFLVYLLIFNASVKSKEVPKNPKIVIIGAGASGIAAASKLFENGFTNVLILEAENRIGGRIHTTSFGDYSVDLGAQWVHGEIDNVAYELAKPYDLLHKADAGSSQEYLDSLGISLPTGLADKLWDFYDKYIYHAHFDNYTKISVGEYVEKVFDKEFKNDRDVLYDKKKFLHHLELLMLGQEPAESWYELPTVALEAYQKCHGNQSINWKNRGYSMILDLLMKRYPDPSKELPVIKNTILNTEVTSIDYSNCAKGSPILISTANGEIYKADHVIITVSLGVLKEQHKTLFIPSLPAEKIAAIEGFEIGNVVKILLLFNEPFWEVKDDRNIFTINFVWNDFERNQTEADPDRKWLLGMYGATTVEYKSSLLNLWVVGKYAKEMETLSDDEVFKHSLENVRRFLGKKYNVSVPIAMLRSQWYSNPHFRGAYSYRSVESQKKEVYVKMLEKPVMLENLAILFAGEATSKYRFTTVDGAIGSGWRAANRLINHYKY